MVMVHRECELFPSFVRLGPRFDSGWVILLLPYVFFVIVWIFGLRGYSSNYKIALLATKSIIYSDYNIGTANSTTTIYDLSSIERETSIYC
jgi:hypothetical protein